MRKMDDRAARIETFLVASGWADGGRTRVAGDASDRRYMRIVLGGARAILMDAPPGSGDDPADFLRIAAHLRAIGLNAPAVYFHDLPNGLLLLEDFGDDTFAKVLAHAPDQEQTLYGLACDVLVWLQAHPAPAAIANLDASDWADAAMIALDWYRFSITGDKVDADPLHRLLTDALNQDDHQPRVLILRDYHAENLMLLPDRAGLSQAGLLDFQLAQMGHQAYDLVSLLQDARREVSPATEAATVARFCAATALDPVAFGRAYAVQGVQRALRIIGIFARLCLVAGKPGYLEYLPRVWGHLQRNLLRSGLVSLHKMCDTLLPAPTPPNLEKIARQCARFAPR